MMVVIFVLVTTSTFRFSLFRRGNKLHGVVSKIAGLKHIGTLALSVDVGSTMVMVVGLDSTVMEKAVVKVQTLTTGVLDGPTIGFSYQYVPEYVKVLSVCSFSVLALKPGIRKRGTASVETDVAKSAAIVKELCIEKVGRIMMFEVDGKRIYTCVLYEIC